MWKADEALTDFRPSTDWLREGLLGMSKNKTCAEGCFAAEMITALDDGHQLALEGQSPQSPPPFRYGRGLGLPHETR